MILPATAVMKAWTPPVKIPDHVPLGRLRLHVRGYGPHHVSEFGLHRANDVA